MLSRLDESDPVSFTKGAALCKSGKSGEENFSSRP
jgi:hypothetical protein